ncbi:hypothetical protein NDN08_006010 [Rhodosorus marinus]|uniref:NADH dehydrogenase [ubiquinone] 1 beta subcomplex subunit 7 n=1 Tax=Rhodosorus marinus TaxID=101924 RepID=A0AAV8UJF9_9RHOD|nr:hypothetical protein NDN08_006010 [Rhodosorus marinus]
MGKGNPLQKYREETFPHHYPEGDRSKMQLSLEECEWAQIPPYRQNYCSHLKVPLKKCMVDNYSLPWKCKYQMHTLEKCEIDLLQKKMREVHEWRQEKLRQEAMSTFE